MGGFCAACSDRAHQSKVDELERHASGLQDSHETKSRELTEIKRHATTVLAQRNEVEQFLLEALDQVKKEMRARRDADLRQKRLAASASPGSGSQRSASLAASGSVPASQTASARGLPVRFHFRFDLAVQSLTVLSSCCRRR